MGPGQICAGANGQIHKREGWCMAGLRYSACTNPCWSRSWHDRFQQIAGPLSVRYSTPHCKSQLRVSSATAERSVARWHLSHHTKECRSRLTRTVQSLREGQLETLVASDTLRVAGSAFLLFGKLQSTSGQGPDIHGPCMLRPEPALYTCTSKAKACPPPDILL